MIAAPQPFCTSKTHFLPSIMSPLDFMKGSWCCISGGQFLRHSVDFMGHTASTDRMAVVEDRVKQMRIWWAMAIKNREKKAFVIAKRDLLALENAL